MNIRPINYQQNTTFCAGSGKVLPVRLSADAVDKICIEYKKATGMVLEPKLLTNDYFMKPSVDRAKNKNPWTDLACIYKDKKGKPSKQLEFMKNNDQWRVFLVKEILKCEKVNSGNTELIKYYDYNGDIYRVACNEVNKKNNQRMIFDFNIDKDGNLAPI